MMSLARMSQHKNRNRRCHLVDELKNMPQNKTLNKQTKTSKTEKKTKKKKKKTESNIQTQRLPGNFLLTDNARTNQEDLRI